MVVRAAFPRLPPPTAPPRRPAPAPATAHTPADAPAPLPRRQPAHAPQKQSLIFRATGTNVAAVEFPPETRWSVDLAGPGGAEVREGIVIDPADEVEVPGGRGHAQLVIRFEGQNHPASVVVLRSGGTVAGEGEEGEALRGCVAQFECRGCEMAGWRALEPVAVRAASGGAFTDVDLADGEWADYDERADASVELMEVSAEFETGLVA